MSTVNIKVLLDDARAKGSLLELKKYARELEGQLGNSLLSKKDQQAIAQRLGEVKGDIDDLRTSVKNFDAGAKFEHMGQALGLVATAMVGVSASLKVFGVESERANKIQEGLNGLIQTSVVLQTLLDTTKRNGMYAHYANLVREWTVNNLMIKQKQTEIASTGVLITLQRVWNNLVKQNPIMLLVTAILALVAAGVALYSVLKDDIEQTKNYEKAIDNVIIKNEKLRESHNNSILELKKLQIEYLKITNAVGDLEAQYLTLVAEHENAMNTITKNQRKAYDDMIAADVSWYNKLFAFFGFEQVKSKEFYDKQKQMFKENAIEREDVEKALREKLDIIVAAANKKLQDIEISKENIIQTKRLETFNKTVDNAKKEFDKIKEYSDKIKELTLQQKTIDDELSAEGITGQKKKIADIDKEIKTRNSNITKITSELELYTKLLDQSRKRLEIEQRLAKAQYESLSKISNPFEQQQKTINDQLNNIEENIFNRPYKQYSSNIYGDVQTLYNNLEDIFNKFKTTGVADTGTLLKGLYAKSFDNPELQKEVDIVTNKLEQAITRYTDLQINLADATAKQTEWNNKIITAKSAMEALNTEVNNYTTSAAGVTTTTTTQSDATKKLATSIGTLKKDYILLNQVIDEQAFTNEVLTDSFDKLNKENNIEEIERQFVDLETATLKYYKLQKELLKLEFKDNLTDPEYLLKLNKLTYEESKAIDLLKNKFKDLSDEIKPLKDQLKEMEQELITLFGTIQLTAIDIVSERMTTMFGNINNMLDTNYNKQVTQIDKLKEYGIISEQESIDRKKAAEDKYNEDKLKQKQREFNFNKKMSLSQIAINTAVAITQALADGRYAMAIIAGVQGALQASVVASTTTPTYKKGGLLIGPSHENGGVLTQFGELEGNEFVVNKKASMANIPTLEAINGDNDLITTLINEIRILQNISANQKLVVPVESINKVQKDLVKIQEKAYI